PILSRSNSPTNITSSRHAPGTVMSASRGPSLAFSRPPTAPVGRWLPNGSVPTTDRVALRTALADLRRIVTLVQTPAGPAVADGGSMTWADTREGLPILAILPPADPASLGDASFCADHGLRFPYVTGAMANGIASAELVEAVSRAGMLAFFGAA